MTTIFSDASLTGNPSPGGYSLRQALTITGAAQGQVRVTFQAAANVGSAGNFAVNNASIGISTQTSGGTAGAYNTTATPVQLTFSASNGFNISTNGATLTSDWVNLTGFTSTSILIVVMDCAATCGCAEDTVGNVNWSTWYSSSNPSYNAASPTGTWGQIGMTNYGVSLIETQAAAQANIPFTNTAQLGPILAQ